jgi:hypothetical protein
MKSHKAFGGIYGLAFHLLVRPFTSFGTQLHFGQVWWAFLKQWFGRLF